MNDKGWAIFLGAFSAALACYDGLRNLVSAGYTAVGSNNVFIGPIWLGGLYLTTFFFQKTRRQEMVPRRGLSFKESEIVYFFMFLICSVFIFSHVDESRISLSVSKGFRDVFYIAFYFLVTRFFVSTFSSGVKGYSQFKVFSFSHAGFYLVVTLLALLFAKFDVEGRFVGPQLSASMFGNYVPFVFFLLAVTVRSKAFVWIVWAISLLLMISSGTRSALIVYAALFFVYIKFFFKVNLSTIFSLSVVAGLLLAILGLNADFLGESRVVSTDDMEGGSAGTRLFWYELLLGELEKSSWLGGAGAGAAEDRIGYITHADFLRFWYDYGLFFLIFFVGWVFFGFFRLARYKALDRAFICLVYVALVFNLSFHNVFQAPSILFELSVLVYVFSRMGEFSKILRSQRFVP